MGYSYMKLIFLLAGTCNVLAAHRDYSDFKLIKREEDIVPNLWDADGPKPIDIGQKPHSDWLLCGAAKIAKSNESMIRDLFEPSDKGTGANQPKSTTVKLYNDGETKTQLVNFNFDYMDDNSVNTKGHKNWWPAALEVAAGLIRDSDYDDKKIKADVGLTMLTGKLAKTTQIKKRNDQVHSALWDTLMAASKSPTCIEKDGRWYGVMSTQDRTSDSEGQITLFDPDKHEEVVEGWNDLYKATDYYSRLEETL
ncbi:uncharacterized protein I206_104799 [Kwoniella pini CBS 10737]|uniref:Uncharacterized protein n=1 Tax=Kwoniella pini CBS 10737 TaxID=1296096 RepID=A0A1B9I7Y9_9TREE|nr:uncharacterized protein I206_02338 [Kwoniella pini CBS 10737]OCF51623.1 hypothetical protein I206_02338 [Kwoniella pini CBS 10737]